MNAYTITTIVVNIVTAISWLTAAAWFALCMFVWMNTRETTSIDQCFAAARCAAALVFGYAVARAVDAVGKCVVAVLDKVEDR